MTGASPPRVYQSRVEGGHEWAMPIEDGHIEIFTALNGARRADTWSPVPMRLVRKDEGRTRKYADLPWLGSHVLILRDDAIDAVGPILADHGELLPLECADADLALFNATRVIDALDEQRSDLVRFSTGQIMDIERPVFRDDVLTEPAVFKIPQMSVGSLYFTSDVVDRIRATTRHRGVIFREVYPSTRRETEP